jgi:hypothetical protein
LNNKAKTRQWTDIWRLKMQTIYRQDNLKQLNTEIEARAQCAIEKVLAEEKKGLLLEGEVKQLSRQVADLISRHANPVLLCIVYNPVERSRYINGAIALRKLLPRSFFCRASNREATRRQCVDCAPGS